jgi:hypothetical protein
MKNLTILFFCFSVFATKSFAGLDAADQTLDKLFTAMNMDMQMNSMIKMMVDAQMKQNPGLEKIRPEYTKF